MSEYLTISLKTNFRKAAGPDKIPAKAIKLAANVIDSHLTNIINNDLVRNSFLESAKIAFVRPLFKTIDQLAF